MYCDNVNKKINNFYTTVRYMTLFKIVLILYKPFNKRELHFPILNALSQDFFYRDTSMDRENYTYLSWNETKQLLHDIATRKLLRSFIYQH